MLYVKEIKMKKIFMFLNFTLGNEIEEISWRLQCQEYLLPLNKYTYDIINDLI